MKTFLLLIVLASAGCGLFHGSSSSAKAEAATPNAPHVWSADEKATVDAYLAKASPKKLQVGAGNINLPGWLNTDLEPRAGQIYLDAAATFPFRDGSFKYVYAEQLIEHLTFEQGQTFLKESFRVLEPGGKLRLATPNLLQIVKLFDPNKTEFQKKFMAYQIRVNKVSTLPTPEAANLNLFVRAWGHQFLYDPQSLHAALTAAGFKDIRDVHLGESDDPELKNVETHNTLVGGEDAGLSGKEVDEYVSQYVEATKP